MMEFDVSTLTLIVGTIIPILVGLVSKEIASSGLKGVLNAILSAAAGVIVVIIENGGTVGPTAEMVNAGFATFLTSIATYYGVWKPTGISATVQRKTASTGINDSGKMQTQEATKKRNQYI